MSKIKKVMVAVDFSEYSPQVVDYAGRLAENLAAELVCVNVIHKRDVDMVKQVGAFTDKISVKSYVDSLKQDRTQEMQKLLEEKNCNRIPNRFIIKTGIPFQELIRTAEEEKVDMVVMGTKGRGNIAGILFGSQAEKMFRHCPVPLLSIREKPE
ncbi:MAG: universal stress protein [Desulfobacterales bacterium]|nr:MAG: universal stress protein [Desulfobacterales bacterium]